MDCETKKRALDKAQSIASYVGYPDELLDDKKIEEFYKNLEITDDDYYQASLNLCSFHLSSSLSRYRESVNDGKWISHSEYRIPNVVYSLTKNSICMFNLISELL